VNHGENMHSNPRIPPARELAHSIPTDARCNCHRTQAGPPPLAFFGFTLGADTLGVGVNTHADPNDGWEVDRPMPTAVSMHGERHPVPEGRFTGYTTAEARWITDTLTRQIRGARD
jgi:hypothetical protein